MATFGEIVYSVLDLLKETSDDAFYTEEHIIFLAEKFRAFLLERKYKGSRNSAFEQVSEENKQQVCLSLSRASLLPAGCGGNWLVSAEVVPEIMSVSPAVTCTAHDLLFTNVTFVPMERMPYVGYNKWLKNIIYAARSRNGHLYLKSNNPQFLYLDRVGVTAVFSNAEEAAKLSHEACMNGGVCEILEQRFPLEAALVPQCIELIVQELTGARFSPEDKKNNAKDDLGEVAQQKAPAKKQETEEEDE